MRSKSDCSWACAKRRTYSMSMAGPRGGCVSEAAWVPIIPMNSTLMGGLLWPGRFEGGAAGGDEDTVVLGSMNPRTQHVAQVALELVGAAQRGIPDQLDRALDRRDRV